MSNGALNSIDELGPLHSMGIVSSVFNKIAGPRIKNGKDLLLEVFDLLSSQELSPVVWRFWEDEFEPFLIACDLSLKEGYHLIFLAGNPETGGHMMGTRVQGNELDFFDPNFALYRFTESAEFMTQVSRHISQYYHHILKLPWLVIKVASWKSDLECNAISFATNLK